MKKYEQKVTFINSFYVNYIIPGSLSGLAYKRKSCGVVENSPGK